MINQLYGGSEFITVSSSPGNTPYINPNQPMTGMMRFNGSSSAMEVYDGNGWQRVGGGSGNIDLSPKAQEILRWAEKKMQEEMAWNELAETNKAVKLALENLEEARRQLTITAKLSREYEQTTN